jgi:2-hydroxy-6-oxonona-2,4-dienedioate hydrolase
MNESWIEVGGVRTHYLSAGDGAPVVLIHGGEIGAPDASAAAWSPCLGALARQFRVLAFDRLGMGRTAPPVRDEDYTLAASAVHAQEFVGAIIDQPAHLVAHGSGARLALELCLGGVTPVRSCTILNSATVTPGVMEIVPRPNWTEAWEPARQIEEHFRSLMSPHNHPPEAAVAAARALHASGSLTEARRKMWNEDLRTRIYLRELGAGRGALFRRMKERAVGAPVLLLNGAQDPLVSSECAALLLQMIAEKQRDVELHLFAACGHYPQLEAPEAVSDLLAAFIDAN